MVKSIENSHFLHSCIIFINSFYFIALTDGSLGDMMFFHSYKNPGLILDILGDLKGINTLAMSSKKTGVIILGGGLVKHHICNANLMVFLFFSS